MRAREARSSASALLALGDVADVAGEHRRAGHVDAGDRQLDRELGPVGAHPGDLDAPVEHHRLPGLEVARQARAVALAQRRRHDQLGHLAADRLVGAVAEGALGGRVELDDAAAVVHARSRVERGLEHRPCLPARAGASASRRRSIARPIWSPSLAIVREAPRRARAVAVSNIDHAEHAARAAQREAQGGVQARPASGRRAREVRVGWTSTIQAGSPVAHTRPGRPSPGAKLRPREPLTKSESSTPAATTSPRTRARRGHAAAAPRPRPVASRAPRRSRPARARAPPGDRPSRRGCEPPGAPSVEAWPWAHDRSSGGAMRVPGRGLVLRIS